MERRFIGIFRRGKYGTYLRKDNSRIYERVWQCGPNMNQMFQIYLGTVDKGFIGIFRGGKYGTYLRKDNSRMDENLA